MIFVVECVGLEIMLSYLVGIRVVEGVVGEIVG